MVSPVSERCQSDPPELVSLVAWEQAQPVPAAAAAVSCAVRERWGDAVITVVFYGSCLRRGDRNGILDFYVIVDSYRAAGDSGALAVANALLPPNVFAVPARDDVGPVRSKVALISRRDFERGVRSKIRSGLWARFSQPVLVCYARDAEARFWLAAQTATAIRTTLERGLPLQPRDSNAFAPRDSNELDAVRFASEAFWSSVFRETYRSEWRPESGTAIDSLLRADPARYERIAGAALTDLERCGRIRRADGKTEANAAPPAGRPASLAGTNGWIRIELPARAIDRARRAREVRLWLSRGLTALALLKGAATFVNWRTYVQGKLSSAGADGAPERAVRSGALPRLLRWALGAPTTPLRRTREASENASVPRSRTRR